MTSTDLRTKRHLIESVRAAEPATDAVQVVGPLIDESWSRCRPLLDTATLAAPVDAEPDEVQLRWDASPIRRSDVGLEEQLAHAAEVCDLVAAVTDEDGRILWSSGGRTMRRAAESVGFIPGGRWDEMSAGTNALGLALRSGSPATVFSAEHWCESVRDWVCWSFPVKDRHGNPLGVIDLSGRWDTATPLAEITVASLGRLVEEHLPEDALAGATPGLLELQLLGRPTVRLGGRELHIGRRQLELLAALALEGPCSLEQLQAHVYGDRAVSPATVKAELSHLRKLLGGGIGSRPYRLTMPIQVDVWRLKEQLHAGDLYAATTTYLGSLLPDSDAPFADDLRHVFDVSLREALLSAGSPAELLRFAAVHPFDEQVLEVAIERSSARDPDHHEAAARLGLARRH